MYGFFAKVRRRSLPWKHENHLFEIRLAVQLISPPRRPLPKAPPEVWQGPATPPVKGLEPVFGRLPKNTNRQWLLDVAWTWRGYNTTPEKRFTQLVVTKTGGKRVNLNGVMAVVGQVTKSVDAIPLNVLTEAQLQEMEQVAPQVAAIARREAQEIKDAERRSAVTRTIARIQQLIVDQHRKWEPRD